jgi:hypothetical protein
MTSEEMAAWLQAIASIIGLVAAFLFPWREILATKHGQREESAARKQLLLRRTVSALKDGEARLDGLLVRRRYHVEGQRLHGSAGHVDVGDFDFGPQYLDFLQDDAYLLGAAAAGELADIVESLEDFRRALTRELPIANVEWADARIAELDVLRGRMEILRKKVEADVVKGPIQAP